ncbi:DUF6188 family protein [Stenotrophomonas tumulicola]|uniref:Uncharacterized protein n=1 Tax=Stenotrophomonas tumulicola TaxID=1685415 RepID=A0A7W3FQF5_9GAMM|nr:DUF6188 family protein [Stenotrophomonas tumulicola]MBA8683717.1 hypothetical protein [Stenotrophomonas tumulicola]
MHPLPKDFDSSILVGRTIESICYAEYQVSLYFSGELTLQIESGYELHGSDGFIESVSSFPVAASSLMSVIGDEVESAEFKRVSGNMVICFNRGASLHLRGDVGQYESYRLTSKSMDIIV